MNIKKIITMVLILVLFIPMFVPVYADSGTYEMHKMTENKYANGASWVKYYYPSGYNAIYKNVVVLYESNGNNSRTPEEAAKFYIIYYSDTCTITAGSGTGFSESVLMIEVTTMKEVENILFKNPDGTYDFQVVTAGPGWSCTWIYTENDFKGYRNHAAVSIEGYYYDYYYEQNGYYPISTNINIEYICSGETIKTSTHEAVAGETITLNKIIEIIDGYNIESINVDGQFMDLLDNYMFTKDTNITVLLEEQKGSADLSGITSTLEKLLALISNPLGDKWKIIFPNAHETIMNNLQNNKFFVSVTAIRNTLTSLFEEDYSSRTGFYELGLFDITVGVPSQDVYTDYGNPATGEWRVGEIQTGKIDWGLKNANLLNLDWFFGKEWEENGNTYYTKGVKEYSDTIIGAFMWLVFGWWLWHNLPDMVMGDIGTVGNLTTRYTTSQEKEQMAAQKQAEQNYKNSYEAYKERMDRTTQYKERYKKEKGGK